MLDLFVNFTDKYLVETGEKEQLKLKSIKKVYLNVVSVFTIYARMGGKRVKTKRGKMMQDAKTVYPTTTSQHATKTPCSIGE